MGQNSYTVRTVVEARRVTLAKSTVVQSVPVIHTIILSLCLLVKSTQLNTPVITANLRNGQNHLHLLRDILKWSFRVILTVFLRFAATTGRFRSFWTVGEYTGCRAFHMIRLPEIEPPERSYRVHVGPLANFGFTPIEWFRKRFSLGYLFRHIPN